MTTATNDKNLWLWDADENFTDVQVIVDEHGRIEVWTTTASNPRMIFRVHAQEAQALSVELLRAVHRYDAIRLEGMPVTVDIDPDSGLLTARLGWARLRRYVVGESFSTTPSQSHVEHVTTMKAPRTPERSWHEAQVAGWGIWQREAYLRMLDALVEAEASREATASVSA